MNTILLRALIRLGTSILRDNGKPHRSRLIKRTYRVTEPLPEGTPKQLAQTPFNRTENRR